MRLLLAPVVDVARAAVPGRDWSAEAKEALILAAEDRVAQVARAAAMLADRRGRRTIYDSDVVDAQKPRPRDELRAYADALESALHQVIEQARRAGVRVEVPPLPPAPLPEVR